MAPLLVLLGLLAGCGRAGSETAPLIDTRVVNSSSFAGGSLAAAAPADTDTVGVGAPRGPDYRIDAMVDWYRFESLKCGAPGGEWTLVVSGIRNLGGGSLVLNGVGLVRLDGTTLRGPWSAQYAIRLEGVPAAIGGQDATVTGDAALVGDVLQIRSQVGAGTFFSQTPALSLGGAAGNPARDFDLPVQRGRFC